MCLLCVIVIVRSPLVEVCVFLCDVCDVLCDVVCVCGLCMCVVVEM